MTWDEIKQLAIEKTELYDQVYLKRIKYEIKEIENQASENYWVDLYNSGAWFKENQNLLLLPHLLGMVDEDPIPKFKHDIPVSTSFKSVSKLVEQYGDIPPGISLDPDRPDIDIDCLPDAREPLRQYLIQKYGEDKVCQVGTVMTYLFRSAIIDVAHASGQCSRETAMALTTELPDDIDNLKDHGESKCRGLVADESGNQVECGFRHALLECPKCRSEDTEDPTIAKIMGEHEILQEFEKQYPVIIDMAIRLIGKIRNPGKHAGALIIADRPLFGNIPMFKNKSDNGWISAWTEGHSPQLSKLGYTKWDLLGLKTLEYIFEACKLIERNHGISFDNMRGWEDIDPTQDRAGYYLRDGEKHYISLNDPKVLKLFNEQKTDTIFQFDTDLAKRTLQHGVRSFEDLTTILACGHPGPLAYIPEWASRRDDPDGNWQTKEHQEVAKLLADTFGIIVYQEQLSDLWINIAGFTSPEAQEARKAVAKKWKEKLKPIKQKWIDGASKKMSVEMAEEYWKRQESFARYAFNKSHAIAYCLVSYQCAWLKVYYPAEWWASVMTNCKQEKLEKFMNSARKEGQKFMPIDVQNLTANFDARDGIITPGIIGIKGIGEAAAAKYSQKFQFTDIDGFIDSYGKDKRVMERLIKLCAFSSLKDHQNSKALWLWYQYKYVGDKEIKETINTKIMELENWNEETIKQEVERQRTEYFKLYQGRKKIPPKIEKWRPKADPGRDEVMALCPDDYTIKEILEFELEYLGYYIHSPLDAYRVNQQYSINNAKYDGKLAGLITRIERAKTKKGNDMLRVFLTDGVQLTKLIVWEEAAELYKGILKKDNAIVARPAKYNKQFDSFSLGNEAIIDQLRLKDM